MNRDERAADWLRMYKSLSDPEEREKAKYITERAARIEARKLDTGYA